MSADPGNAVRRHPYGPHMTTHAAFGLRCTSMDALGNRCVKDFTHMDSTHGTERWHDATRGLVERRWA